MEDRRTNGRMATIMLQRSAPTVYNNFPRSALWLSVVQTICGVAMVITGIIGLVMSGYAGMLGFSVSVWVILAGSFGIAAGSKKTICEITTSMVFSILAAINSIALTMIMGNQLRLIAAATPDSRMSEMESTGYMDSLYKSNIALCLVLVIFSFIEAIISISISVIGCHFSCFCCRNCCCKFDLTSIEKGIIYEGQFEQILQPIAYNTPSVPSAYVITNQQQQTMYQPMATTASGGGSTTGNNAWLQNNKYTGLDDDMLTA